MFKILKKKVEEKKEAVKKSNEIKRSLYARKKAILSTLLKEGRVIQVDVIKNRIEFLNKMSTTIGKAEEKHTEDRFNALVSNVAKQWNALKPLVSQS